MLDLALNSPPATGSPMRERVISGYRVRARRLGVAGCDMGQTRRPVAVLVHGMIDSGNSWTPLLPALSGFDVWCLDLPWSGDQGSGWPAAMLTDGWLRAGLTLCPAAPALCVGHSFGATAILEWFASVPDAAPEAAILISPFLRPPGRRVTWASIDSFARGVEDRLEGSLRVRFGAKAPDDAVVAAMARKLACRVMPDGLLELFRLYVASGVWRFNHVTARMLAVAGEHDFALALDGFDDIAHRFRHGRAARIPQCGHYCMHEQSAAVRRLVTAFVGQTTCAA